MDKTKYQQYMTADEYLDLCAKPPRFISFEESERYSTWREKIIELYDELYQGIKSGMSNEELAAKGKIYVELWRCGRKWHRNLMMDNPEEMPLIRSSKQLSRRFKGQLC